MKEERSAAETKRGAAAGCAAETRRGAVAAKTARMAGMLCLALVVSGIHPMTADASPDFAYSTDRWSAMRDDVLEYGELADLIHEYNATVINNRLQYDDYRDKSHDDMKNAYQDIADHLNDSSDKMMDMVNEDQATYGSAAASSISARLQAEQNQELADAQNEDGRVKKLEYDLQEAALVKDAQTMMVSYWQKAKERPALDEALSLAKSQHEAAEVKAGQGMMTQAELLAAREKLEAAQADLETNQKEMDGLRRELCVMTGWSYDANPEIREIPTPEDGEVSAIDLETDKEMAITASFTQTANERRLKYTGVGSQQDAMEKKVESGRQQIKSDVEAKYKQLLQAQADYAQAEGEWNLAEKNARSSERRFSLGTISQNQYLEQQGGQAAKQSAMDVAGLKYRQAMTDYRWAVNGLAQTEGA